MSDEKQNPQEKQTQPVELSAEDLKQVVGGQAITINKAKTADKAFSAMDAYIKG